MKHEESVCIPDLVLRTAATVAQVSDSSVDFDTSVGDLSLDSLGTLAVVGHIEAVLGFEFEVEETLHILKVEDLGELVQLVEAAVAQRSRDNRSSKDPSTSGR